MKITADAAFYGNDSGLLDQLLSASQQSHRPLSQRVTPRQLATVLVYDGPRDDGKGDVDAVARHLSMTLPVEPSGVLNEAGRAAEEQDVWNRALHGGGLVRKFPLGMGGRGTFGYEQRELRRKRDEAKKQAVKGNSTSSPPPIPHDQQFMLINLANLESKREVLDEMDLLGSFGARRLMKALGWPEAERQAQDEGSTIYVSKSKAITELSRNVPNIESLLANSSRPGSEWLQPYKNPKGNGWELEGLTQALKTRKEWIEPPAPNVFAMCGK